MNTFLKYLFISLTAASAAQADALLPSCCTDASLADGHFIQAPAPISVMGDHTHHAGGWMLSYRHSATLMQGMRSGDARASSDAIFAEGYTITPERMEMEMHMLGLMYAPSDVLTLMLMGHYHSMEMDHRIVSPMAAGMINSGAQTFTSRSQGWGDTQLVALYRVLEQPAQRMHLGLGISLPTGSITETDRLPGMGGPAIRLLPASMQLGSGTYDLLPALTYVGRRDAFSFGLQAQGIVRLESENSRGYRLGNRLELNAWLSRQLNEWSALSGGLSYSDTGRLQGTQQDVSLSGPAGRSVTTAFGENYGGQRLEAVLGFSIGLPPVALAGHRIALDLRVPLAQRLNGSQLETDWQYTLGWQWAF